jgi:hypothetical protein
MPRSSTIDGIATFTMVLSTMMSDTAMLMNSSPNQRAGHASSVYRHGVGNRLRAGLPSIMG